MTPYILFNFNFNIKIFKIYSKIIDPMFRLRKCLDMKLENYVKFYSLF